MLILFEAILARVSNSSVGAAVQIGTRTFREYLVQLNLHLCAIFQVKNHSVLVFLVANEVRRFFARLVF